MSPKQVKALRQSLGLSQHQFAIALGFKHRSSVCLLENENPRAGRRPNGPLLEFLKAIKRNPAVLIETPVDKGKQPA